MDVLRCVRGSRVDAPHCADVRGFWKAADGGVGRYAFELRDGRCAASCGFGVGVEGQRADLGEEDGVPRSGGEGGG